MGTAVSEQPRILDRSDHSISRRNIETNALKVLYRLHHAGFKSYLVGGAVRDLMLGRQPKDFDISTDARPQQIRRLFRNSRIIGRRFRLVHVYFREGIVEVSTFRRSPDPTAQESAPDDLLITDDNVFGGPVEDAYRRDFTVNALFYDIADFSVIDYVGGTDDLVRQEICTIGDPEVRFCEDPVRMLRACELAGRLDFTIQPNTEAAIRQHRREIEKCSPARLSEEIGQILSSGRAERILRLAMQLGLLEVFLPEAYTLLTVDETTAEGFVRVPNALDHLIAAGKEFSEPVLLGSMLLPAVLLRRRDVEALDGHPIRRSALRELINDVVAAYSTRFTLSRAKTERLLQAMWAFHRLGERWRSVAHRVQFVTQPGFDDALHLLEILVTATGVGGKELELWQRIRDKVPERQAGRPARRRRRQRRRGRR